jgi:hypothetical protein
MEVLSLLLTVSFFPKGGHVWHYFIDGEAFGTTLGMTIKADVIYNCSDS